MIILNNLLLYRPHMRTVAGNGLTLDIFGVNFKAPGGGGSEVKIANLIIFYSIL